MVALPGPARTSWSAHLCLDERAFPRWLKLLDTYGLDCSDRRGQLHGLFDFNRLYGRGVWETRCISYWSVMESFGRYSLTDHVEFQRWEWMDARCAERMLFAVCCAILSIDR